MARAPWFFITDSAASALHFDHFIVLLKRDAIAILKQPSKMIGSRVGTKRSKFEFSFDRAPYLALIMSSSRPSSSVGVTHTTTSSMSPTDTCLSHQVALLAVFFHRRIHFNITLHLSENAQVLSQMPPVSLRQFLLL